jgi:hypothetical protein
MVSWDTGSLTFQKSLRHAVKLLGTAPNFNQGVKLANNFTIAIWFKMVPAGLASGGSELFSLGNHTILRVGRNSTTNYSMQWNKHYPGGGYVQCQNATVSQTPVPSYLNGNWHHFAVIQTTADPGMAMYLDGAPLACTTFNNAGTNNVNAKANVNYSGLGSDLWVGRHGQDNTMNFDLGGNLDELRVYTRVLSLPEIQALAAGTQLPPP